VCLHDSVYRLVHGIIILIKQQDVQVIVTLIESFCEPCQYRWPVGGAEFRDFHPKTIRIPVFGRYCGVSEKSGRQNCGQYQQVYKIEYASQLRNKVGISLLKAAGKTLDIS